MDIVDLDPDQIPVAGEILARSLFDDGLAVHMFPDAEERRSLGPWHFSAMVRYGVLFGRVLTTVDEPSGVAIWLPPGETSMTESRIAAAGLDASPAMLGEQAFGRFLTAVEKTEEFHSRDMRVPHWYLALLGVDPDESGKGVGGALLRHTLVEADEGGMPCYLETAEQRNVGFYKQFGFRVLRQGHLAGTAVNYWTMMRPPRSAGSDQ